LAPSEKERHRDTKKISGLLKPTSAHTVEAFFVLLYLLKSEAKCFTQLFLTHAKHFTPLA